MVICVCLPVRNPAELNVHTSRWCFAESLLSVLRFVGFAVKITTRFTQINSFNQFFNER